MGNSKYLLRHKRLDEYIIQWEKLHNKNEQKESLPSFIARQQAIFLLGIFIDKGFSIDEAKIELNKLIGGN